MTVNIGEVGTPAEVISVTPTIDGAVYQAGDAVGGKQTLTGAARELGGEVILESLLVIDKANQKKALTVIFFESDPAAATITNNAAFVFSTDIAKVVGKVNVAAADYESVNSLAVASLKNLGLLMRPSGSATLYAVVVTTEAPDYVADGDLIFRYGFLQG